MKLVASATALTLVLALAACGGSNADTTTTAETATVPIQPGQDIGPTPGAISTPVPSATATDSPPEATATPTPTPSPSMKATPTPTPSPSATVAAAATKPAEFAQCQACHSTEAGKNGIGPSLAHVYDRKSGSLPGYDYSEPMKSAGMAWNQANLDRFLTDPQGVVPGTKMTFPGLKDAAKRKAVIGYLKSL